MHSEQITEQEVNSFLFNCAKSEFNNFEKMSSYLANLQQGLTSRFITLQRKRESLLSEYKTCVTAEEINEKRRGKEQNQLKSQESKLKEKLNLHEKNMRVEVHQMIPQLRIKRDEIKRLEETQELLGTFKRLVKGDDLKEVIAFTDNNFEETARKISILKAVIDDLPESETYKEARGAIAKLLLELKERILNRFQSAYWTKDLRQIKDTLPLCMNLNLMENVSEFFLSKIFRNATAIKDININDQKAVFNEVTNLFYLLKKGFKEVFTDKENDLSDINQYQIFRLFQGYSENILKSLMNKVFESFIKDSLENVFKHPLTNTKYLTYLQNFIEQTKTLRAQILLFIDKNQSLIYTVDSYISIIFEPYQEQYLSKQLGYLYDIYETNSIQIMKKIQVKVEQSNKKREFNWKNLFRDYKIQQSETLTGDEMNQKLSLIHSMFMDPSLECIFNSTNVSLQRNIKVSKSTEKEKNAVKILNDFMKEMGELILNLIKYTGSLIPAFGRKTVLSEQYFDIVPLLNTTVQRMQLIFETFSVEKSNLNESIKLVQQKEELMNKCEQELQKILNQALSSLIITSNSILKEQCAAYKCIKSNQSATQGCTKAINFISKYIRKIRTNFSSTSQLKILEMMGNQFLDLLLQHYTTITYSKQGLYQLLVDIGHYKQFVLHFNNQDLENKYGSFKGLVDIYLLKNEEISLMNYITQEKERSQVNIKQQLINRYLDNKRRNEAV